MIDLSQFISLDFFSIAIHKEFKSKILASKTITYGNPKYDTITDQYYLDKRNDVVIDIEDKKTTGKTKGFVYLLLDNSNNVLYVGSSRDIKGRLDSHLIKNNKIKKDGSPRASLTGSEINNVYEYVKSTKSIKYCYTSIEPWYMYTAVESFLIDYYRKFNLENGIFQIWNAGFKDDDALNETSSTGSV